LCSAAAVLQAQGQQVMMTGKEAYSGIFVRGLLLRERENISGSILAQPCLIKLLNISITT
jgi:hypothetical protein